MEIRDFIAKYEIELDVLECKDKHPLVGQWFCLAVTLIRPRSKRLRFFMAEFENNGEIDQEEILTAIIALRDDILIWEGACLNFGGESTLHDESVALERLTQVLDREPEYIEKFYAYYSGLRNRLIAWLCKRGYREFKDIYYGARPLASVALGEKYAIEVAVCKQVNPDPLYLIPGNDYLYSWNIANPDGSKITLSITSEVPIDVEIKHQMLNPSGQRFLPSQICRIDSNGKVS